ncbi:MAG: hypothetical protein Q7J42_06465 [Sulfuritalea sp.]|nr:hypothetical protein [Sulfuritalea sp.]
MNKKSIDASPHIATAKVFTCESLSGLCVLHAAIGYEVGTTDRLYIRITESNGMGKFNSCWWSLADIEKALAKVPEQDAFKAPALAPVFAGRSVNTLYFVISALLSIGLLRRAEPVENGYVRNVPAELLKELQTLIEAGTDLLPATMAEGAGPMAVTIPKAAKKSSKKSAAPVTA